jgi:hypothetical protein
MTMVSVWGKKARFTSWDEKGYEHVEPFGLGNMTFNNDVIDLPVIIVMLSLGVKIGVGTSSNCEDCAMGGKIVSLLRRLLNLRWRWRWWVGFDFDLRVGVVWH